MTAVDDADENRGEITLEFTALDGSRHTAILIAGEQPMVEIVPLLEEKPALEQSATKHRGIH